MSVTITKNVTEVYIYTNSKKGVEDTGTHAIARICLGDATHLLLLYSKMADGTVKWRSATVAVHQNGHSEPIDVISGTLLEEAKKIAGLSVDRIKATFGALKTGKTYRCANKKAELVENPAAAAA